jgi:hypothetical protein
MSRLYYDRPSGSGRLAGGQNGNKEYTEKIVKLIPTEIIAGYLFLIGLVDLVKFDNLKLGLYVLIFMACWIATPFYIRWQGEKDTDPETKQSKPWKIHAAVSCFAFLFWSYSVSGNILVPNYYDVALANILLGLFTIVTGWIPLKT